LQLINKYCMANLKQIFLNTLLEQEAPESETNYDAQQDEAPLRDRLAKNDVPEDALDVEPGPPNTGYKAEVAAAEDWIQNIDEFVKYLNDTATGSINRQVNVLDRDNSVFKGIASRISDKVARVSSDLAELKEIIAGFVIASDRKAKNIRMADSFESELTPSEIVIERLSRCGFEYKSSSPASHRMVLETADGELFAEINQEGLVNGESIDEYMERLNAEYNITELIDDADETIIGEDVIMDEKIVKQIKEIDVKLATKWDYDLYIKRRELLSKMETNYIDVAKSLVEGD